MRRPTLRLSLAQIVLALAALGGSTLAAQTTINQFPLPAGDLQLLDIAAGPDGNLWFVVMGDGSPGTSKVGRITTSGTITELVLPDDSQPIGICAGPDGALWFTESKTPAIGRLDPATFPVDASVTHFSAGIAPASNPFGICAGPDGALWFTERDGSAIGRITTAGAITEFPITAPAATPLGIVTGPDGNLWFTDRGDAMPSIGALSAAGAIVKRIPTPGLPTGVTVGPDGRIWFVEFSSAKVGVLATGATSMADITEYATPTPGPFRIATGPDGALWFTENGGGPAGRIARITTSGAITEFAAPGLSGPYGIALGPDRAVWFTERDSSPTKVGQLLVDCVVNVPAITGGGTQCSGTTLTLTATAGWSSYQWSLDGGAIPGATSATYTKTARPEDTGSYTVAGANGSCLSNPSAPVTVTIDASAVATTGGPQTICAYGSTAGLGGNVPAAGAGTWSVVSGGAGTFVPDATTADATFTHAAGAGPITLRWSVSSSSCGDAADLLVTVRTPPTAAAAGGPQTICAGGTTAGLGGNTPAVGAGAWSVVGGGTGTFAPSAAAPNATFTHTGGAGPVTLRWSVSNPPCASSAADVVVTVVTRPTTAAAGGPQTICAGGTTAGLGGNSPIVGTGAWSVVSGGTGTFAPSSAAPNAVFTHTGGAGPVLLAWTISNGVCASAATVAVAVSQPPTAATAGPAQTICNLGTSRPLGGNAPAAGTGAWSVVSGGTGTFSPSASSPNAVFTHTGGAGPVVLAWTISSPPCPPSAANVTLTVGATCPSSLAFFPVAPCRRIDTRLPADAPALAAGEQRSLALVGPPCGIPASARAVSVNVTVTGATSAGDLKFFPTGLAVPTSTVINFGAGRTRANNAVLAVSWDGAGRADVKSGAAGSVHVIVDVNGYFQ